ncbi:SUMF1/EgtB/PvdO family nonheme iron enzyme [Ruficoccus sp. ZRK36]|uniref:formylglycine-generating enzyme family protein n=1 Tax=Ruficoccus sp. ZRK36 TaxID=2866311 RepID=UPI001C72A2A0|nr:SUMF1/EgtB/PvdO family nonheme iron enzyme [Ruficoccus sp. ZRK36]QYY37071.1 SUMF1/EgtB/PvdO family nonheme iron enzyme [Ruficoccus sp. ZRK36]
MPRHRKERSFWYRYRVLLRVLFISLIIAIGLGGAYALSLLGPQKVDPSSLSSRVVNKEEALKLLEASQTLEAKFVEISALREPTAEDIDVLEQAIAKQEEYQKALGGYNSEAGKRLESLQILYQDTMAAQDYRKSLSAERQGVNYDSQDDAEMALRNYREAAALQRKINDDYPLSNRRDVGRLTQLERKVNELRAEPLWNASNEAERRSKEAAEKDNWALAKKELAESIHLQKELNMEFRGLHYADVTRLSRLQVDLASMESSDIYEQIVEMETKGREALENKQYSVAAENLNAASRLQIRLNQEHPQSRFASNKRADELRDLGTDALSREVGEEILADLDELDQSLRTRQIWQAGEIIPGLFDKVEAFRTSYPRSTLLTEDTVIKLRFLKFIKDDIALLQDRIYGQLLPIPESDGWHMTRYEVSQALYRSIMLNNPSRHVGETLPVDSVNWDEASEFCTKVSWILGLPARLPTKQEFDTAIGSLRYVNLNDISWNASNSGDETHEVGTKEPNKAGYFDLLGNVEEWLVSTDILSNDQAYVAGGSAQDTVDQLADVPFELDNPRRRDRMGGFRLTVNLNPSSNDANADSAPVSGTQP